LGGWHRRQGELDKTIAGYRQVIALNPKDATPYHGLGVALQEKGDLEEPSPRSATPLRSTRRTHKRATISAARRLDWRFSTATEPSAPTVGRQPRRFTTST
jgi:hypothetical protein